VSAPSRIQSPIPRGLTAKVILKDGTYGADIQVLKIVPRSIRASIVHNNNLDLDIVIPNEATADRLIQVRLAVIRRNDNCYVGWHESIQRFGS
jgi:hypothetical protein